MGRDASIRYILSFNNRNSYLFTIPDEEVVEMLQGLASFVLCRSQQTVKGVGVEDGFVGHGRETAQSFISLLLLRAAATWLLSPLELNCVAFRVLPLSLFVFLLVHRLVGNQDRVGAGTLNFLRCSEMVRESGSRQACGVCLVDSLHAWSIRFMGFVSRES